MNQHTSLVLNENVCDCGHHAGEHYIIEGKEGYEKLTHCEADGCSCELFTVEQQQS